MVDNKAEFTKFVADKFDQLKAQFIAKQTQYGNSDPLVNFRTGAALQYGEATYETMYRTALGYENKHVSHVYNNGIDGSKVDESLSDIAIYSIIELYMIYKQNKSKNLEK